MNLNTKMAEHGDHIYAMYLLGVAKYRKMAERAGLRDKVSENLAITNSSVSKGGQRAVLYTDVWDIFSDSFDFSPHTVESVIDEGNEALTELDEVVNDDESEPEDIEEALEEIKKIKKTLEFLHRMDSSLYLASGSDGWGKWGDTSFSTRTYDEIAWDTYWDDAQDWYFYFNGTLEDAKSKIASLVKNEESLSKEDVSAVTAIMWFCDKEYELGYSDSKDMNNIFSFLTEEFDSFFTREDECIYIGFNDFDVYVFPKESENISTLVESQGVGKESFWLKNNILMVEKESSAFGIEKLLEMI